MQVPPRRRLHRLEERGKLVYLDKYEITAGRMRAIPRGAREGPGERDAPDVKAWITAHTPSRWNKDWTDLMPEGWEEGQLKFTVSRAPPRT